MKMLLEKVKAQEPKIVEVAIAEAAAQSPKGWYPYWIHRLTKLVVEYLPINGCKSICVWLATGSLDIYCNNVKTVTVGGSRTVVFKLLGQTSIAKIWNFQILSFGYNFVTLPFLF